jgi:tRNA-splicing ligase RtcB
VRGVGWAQKFAASNREVMMTNLIATVRKVITRPFEAHVEAVNCHHNYVQQERHFGEDVFDAQGRAKRPTPWRACVRWRRTASRPCAGTTTTCRLMSRTKAKKLFTVDDQIKATEGVECRKDKDVIDEIPMAYKDIEQPISRDLDVNGWNPSRSLGAKAMSFLGIVGVYKFQYDPRGIRMT